MKTVKSIICNFKFDSDGELSKEECKGCCFKPECDQALKDLRAVFPKKLPNTDNYLKGRNDTLDEVNRIYGEKEE